MTSPPAPAPAHTKAAFKLSRDVTHASAPAIPVARRWIAQYDAHATQPLIDVSQGVPGTPPPPLLLHALSAASALPTTSSYGPILGEPPLRAALAAEMRALYGPGADVREGDVAVSAGCNLAFVAVVMCLCESGDEVVLAVPWYFNQQQILEMRGVVPVPLRTRAADGFLPRVADAARLLTARTRAIALVSPNNPTGAVYPPALLAQFARLCKAHRIALVLDETYRDFVGSRPHALFTRRLELPGPVQAAGTVPVSTHSSAAAPEDVEEEGNGNRNRNGNGDVDADADVAVDTEWEWRRHLIHLFSFSKSYAVPGHRLGAVVCGGEVMVQLEKVLDCLQICPPRAIQLALSAQLPLLRPFIALQHTTLRTRHAALLHALPPHSHWHIAAQGGFFAYLRHPFPGRGSTEVCERLARDAGVVGLPGAFFQPGEGDGFWEGVESARAQDRWVRISVANVGVESLRMVGERLAAAEERWGWEMD